MEMLADTIGLEGVREDLVNLLAVLLGRTEAEARVADIEKLVQSQVLTALDTRLPMIKSTIKTEGDKYIMPFFLGTTIVGGIAILVGIVAIARRRR